MFPARAGIATGFALLALAPALAAQEPVEPPPYPAPGKLVDVGGWRLHLNCSGDAVQGRPIVIL
ncbi:MAG TPA: hypothetical protein VL241_06270, partial [Gemmatimonadales bacterium]|nr:hypothetical protein [Gemmatimonadales bacterium]